MPQTRTAKFREQHNELLALAKELGALLDETGLSQSGAEARSCLSRLMGKLVMHLTVEDNVLYPELKSSKDPAVSGLARRSADEMAKITRTISAYNDKWRTPSSIQVNPTDFITESKLVLFLLSKRIKWENQELYAACDRLEGKAFA